MRVRGGTLKVWWRARGVGWRGVLVPRARPLERVRMAGEARVHACELARECGYELGRVIAFMDLLQEKEKSVKTRTESLAPCTYNDAVIHAYTQAPTLTHTVVLDGAW